MNNGVNGDGNPVQTKVKQARLAKYDNLPDGTPDRAKGPVEVVIMEYNEDETLKSVTRHFPGDPQCL